MVGVTRVFGMLDPANVASAMVLERSGFLYEGRTRSSYWKADEVSDDLIYGMLRSDRDTWRDRLTTPPNDVRLIEVTTDNFEAVARLTTHESQKRFVAPMLWSFTDAHFPEIVDGAPVIPWMKAITADDELAGFVMLAMSGAHHPAPYLWRMLIDRVHQRRGIGSRGLDLVVEECRRRGDSELLTSWEEGRGSPRPFYERYGFKPTGRIVDEETEALLVFD
jgi:RimJ/RimL family protein N-acetyltransferase